jgi:transcriptional regulator with XRE-family HTH domain
MGSALSNFLLEKTRNMNQVDLARALGVSQSFLSRLKSGQIKTADATLAVDMAVFFHEPIQKMLSLVGKDAYYAKMKEALFPEFQKDPIILEAFPDESTKIEFDRFRSRDDFLPIRIVGAGSLGPGRFVSSEETKGYALIYRHALPKKAAAQKRDREKIVCLFAEGQSMTPTIQDGSLVAVDIEDRAEIHKNKIYAVELPDAGVTLKRVIRSADHFMLFADNPNEPGFPTCVSMEGLGYNPICGRVVWAWNKF